MALTWPHLLQFRAQSSTTATNHVFFSDHSEFRSVKAPLRTSITLFQPSEISVVSACSFADKDLKLRVRCFSESTEEKQWSETETVASDSDEASNDELEAQSEISVATNGRIGTTSSSDYLTLGIREPIYEVYFFSFVYLQ